LLSIFESDGGAHLSLFPIASNDCWKVKYVISFVSNKYLFPFVFLNYS
jgi:hypothetical protein